MEKYSMFSITHFLKYHGFISCLTKYSEKFDGDNASKIEYSYIPRNIDVFLKSKKGHQRYVCNIE
jgi:hypothetical protein